MMHCDTHAIATTARSTARKTWMVLTFCVYTLHHLNAHAFCSRRIPSDTALAFSDCAEHS
jgi:hypothetical protein